MASLVAGCVAIVLVMLIFPDSRWPRDLLWSIGVAALVFALVVNYLVKRADRAGAEDRENR
jgi:hypothetical protein